MKPVLDPKTPFADRMLLTELYRLHEAARADGDMAGMIRAKKALNAAKIAAARATVEAAR
jgi:hypothetical protein